MKEVARSGGGRALVIEALRILGATVGQVLAHNGTEFVPTAAGLPGAHASSHAPDGSDPINAETTTDAGLEALFADEDEGSAIVGDGNGSWRFVQGGIKALLATTSNGALATALAAALGVDAAAVRTALSAYSQAEVDSAIGAAVGGLLYKGACRAVATSNVAALSGYPTFDGVTIGAGDANKRVLLVAQSAPAENGPWITAAGAWSRPASAELQSSAAFPVTEGTLHHDTVWYLTTNDPITPGVTGLALSQLALNIPASQIADSTVAGRALLTAATVAAQIAALLDTLSSSRGAQLVRGASIWGATAIGSAGKLWRSNGTDPAWSTLTIPDTAARGTVLVATGTDTVTALNAKTADTFLGGDGTDVGARTAAQVRTSIGSGFRSSGTLAARPASPAIGDSYEVTSGPVTGDRYVCFVAGTWVLLDYATIVEPETQPLLRYKCNEAAGAAALVNSGSASSANLTLTGSAYALGVATGLPYGLRSYPVASNYATGATAVQPAYPITIRAWVYFVGFTVAYAKVLYKAYNAASWSSPEGMGLTFSAALDGSIVGHITVGGTRRTVFSSREGYYPTKGQWSLIAMTYDGATMELSVNGISVGTTAQAGAIDYGGGTAQPWMLGGNSRVVGTNEPIDGFITEACVDGSVIPLATLRQWYLRGVRRAT